MIFIITRNVFNKFQLMFVVGVLGMVLFAGLVQFNFLEGHIPMRGKEFLGCVA